MEQLLQDLRFAFRQLLKRRDASLVAIFTLALGIGANTSVFTLINSTLLRPAPAAEPSRLVWISRIRGREGRPGNGSYPHYRAIRDQAKALSGVLAYSGVTLSVGGTASERIYGNITSGNYFEVLGVKPALGRTYSGTDDTAPGASPVVVLSDALWRRRFGADPRIVGSAITVNGRSFSVVGVTPPGFGGIELGEGAEMWVPMAMIAVAMPGRAELLDDAHAGWLRTVGRLAPGATSARAQAEADVAVQRVVARVTKPDDVVRTVVQQIRGGLDPSNRSELMPVVLLLSIVPLLVLLVACANSANLLLSRALVRRKEFAVRRALGATRGRLVRQLLTECLLLSAVAGLVGMVLSYWLTSLISRLGDVPADVTTSLQPDFRVLGATLVLSLLTGLVFGLVPALTATRPSLAPALKDEGGSMAASGGRPRIRGAFVVAQVAVSLVLLITAGLFLRSLNKALAVDPGFDAQRGLALSYDLQLQGYDAAGRERFDRRALETARAIPGVESAAQATGLPLSSSWSGADVDREGAPPDSRGMLSGMTSVTPAFFATMHIPLLKGREFSDRDDAGAARAVIVNATLAGRLWPGEDPVGKRLRFAGSNTELREVVGLVADGKYRSLTERPSPYFYLPFSQDRRGETQATLVVRASQSAAALVTPVSRAIRALDPDLPLYRVGTLDQAINEIVGKQRAATSLIGVFGALALLLASLGMYGVAAQAVTLRTREIGIRMSLGARSRDVLVMFVREGVGRSLVGVALGLAISLALGSVLAQFLYGLRATDVPTFFAGAGVLCSVSALATWLPARRAANVDPMVALRYD